MKAAHEQPGICIYQGDVRAVLPKLPDGSVNCCVTSPPYWGLRDYGTAKWEGGDSACEHRVGGQVHDSKARGAITAGVRPGVDASICLACGAERVDSQLGLEPTPQAYVESMVAVFRQVRRVLTPDGTLWLNLGDSYASIGRSERKESPGVRAKQSMAAQPGREVEWLPRNGGDGNFEWRLPGGIKPKDLVGIPWRVAFALQNDGWYLRSDIVWSKPNVMPESVVDRPTRSHEFIFLLTRSERYAYDGSAIKEPAVSDHASGNGFKREARLTYEGRGNEEPWDDVGGMRNSRDVWAVNTQRYPGAHFATFPPEIPTRCIKAGCPVGGTVLDPFHGSGTTMQVARELGRRYVGVELNPDYIELSKDRVRQEVLFGVTA